MSFLTTNYLKKIANASLALVLTSSVTLSTSAFANETTNETTTTPATNYETVDLQKFHEELENQQIETPNTIPGDFFYFAKIAFEKIKLALTFDDAKEAELMATYASVRLAEAAALYDEGKETEALEVIEAAIDYIESSQEMLGNAADNTADATTPEDTETTDDSTGESTPVDNNTEDDEADTGNNEAEGPTIDEGNDESESPSVEVEGTIRNNIVALTAAMEHVGNDKARASLQKNIDKTYAKISKKLEKLENKYGVTKKADKDVENAPEVTVEEVSVPVTTPESSPKSANLTKVKAPKSTTSNAAKTVEKVTLPNPGEEQAKQNLGKEIVKEKQKVKPNEKKDHKQGNRSEAHKNNKENKNK